MLPLFWDSGTHFAQGGSCHPVPIDSSNAPDPSLSTLCSSAQFDRKQEASRPRRRSLRGDALPSLSLVLSTSSLPALMLAGPTQAQVSACLPRLLTFQSTLQRSCVAGARLTQPLCSGRQCLVHPGRCAFHQSTPSPPLPRLEFTVTTKNVPDKPTRTTLAKRAGRTQRLRGEEGARGISRVRAGLRGAHLRRGTLGWGGPWGPDLGVGADEHAGQ